MAISVSMLDKARRKYRDNGGAENWTKAQANAVLQALDDAFDLTCQPALVSALNGAYAGTSALEKARIIKTYLELKIELS